MKIFEPLHNKPVVGQLETVIVRGVGGKRCVPIGADEYICLPFQEGTSLIGRKGYKNGNVGLSGIVETVQLVIRHSDDGVQVMDCGSENGNILVRARSAEAFLALRTEFDQDGSAVHSQREIAPLLDHPDDVTFLGRTHAGEDLRYWPLEKGDLIDHLYATWLVVLRNRT